MDVHILTQMDRILCLRDAWQVWQNQPNNDFDQFLLICRTRSEVDYPWVMVATVDDKPVALLAGRVEITPFAPSIGYLKPIKIPVRTLILLHHGILGRQDEEIATALVAELQSWLARQNILAVFFPQLAMDSPLRSILARSVSSLSCELKLAPQKHWQSVTPGPTATLLKGMKSKVRYAIISRQRILQTDYGDQLVWQWMTHFDNVSGILQEIDKLASHTYQHGLGGSIRNDEQNRLKYQLFADRGLLRVALLKRDKTLISFLVGIIYNDVLYVTGQGYDTQYRNYGPGIALIIWMMERLREENVLRIDWGLGDYEYKKKLGAYAWLEHSIWLFKLNIFGLSLRLLLRLTKLTDKLARYLLEKTNMTNKIKFIWRRYVTSPQN